MRNDHTGEFLNTIFGAVAGAVTAVLTKDPRESWKQAAVRGAVTGAIAGFALDACIATGGTASLVIAAVGGFVSGGIDKKISKSNVGEKATIGEMLVSATIGAVANFGFGHISQAGKYVKGDSVKSVLNAMWQNTKNGFTSPKGNFVNSKAIHTISDGMFGAFSGSFITWYGNLRLGGL